MNLKSIYRILTLIAGVCTVAVILLSKVVPASSSVAKEKDSKDKTEVTIHAPSDVASQSTSVDVPASEQTLIATLQQDENQEGKFALVKTTFTTLFKTLFRVIISPNAP
jgi:hypothetical protein